MSEGRGVALVSSTSRRNHVVLDSGPEAGRNLSECVDAPLRRQTSRRLAAFVSWG